MKNLRFLILISLISSVSQAQDVDALFAAGVENAEQFTDDYLMPGTNGLMHSMNANWFNTAEAKPLGGFEISVVTNAVVINDEHKSFTLNIADYNSDDYDFTVAFADDETLASKDVATALGENDPDVALIVRSKQFPNVNPETITLPSGIGESTKNLLPTAFLQAALGLSKGIEVKARFVPKIETDELELSLYGAGLQMEFTKWLPGNKLLPVSLSGLVAYTHMNGSYDITESSGIDGENQKIENNTDTWLFQLIGSTKLPVINFYGGLGYIKGSSQSDVLGTYTVTSGPLISRTETDPFSVTSDVAAVRGTLGFKLKLGFFRLNGEYHLSEYNAFALGINFGFR